MNLILQNIKKAYGKNLVLDDISAEMSTGIYGLLGANGVGKTTLFKIISGSLTNYQGTITYPAINGKKQVLLGFLPQNFSGYPDMTIHQFLLYLGTIKSTISKKKILRDIEEKLELFNLTELRDKKLKTLSGGQLRRVGLAQAFQLNPKVIMLDEPTTGLDPTERIKFKNYIAAAGHQRTILVSTHIVTDLELTAKEIFILKNGHFVMKGTEKELIKKCYGLVWDAEFTSQQELSRHTVSMVYDAPGKIKARIISSSPPSPDALKAIPTLNDVYLINFRKESRTNGI